MSIFSQKGLWTHFSIAAALAALTIGGASREASADPGCRHRGGQGGWNNSGWNGGGFGGGYGGQYGAGYGNYGGGYVPQPYMAPWGRTPDWDGAYGGGYNPVPRPPVRPPFNPNVGGFGVPGFGGSGFGVPGFGTPGYGGYGSGYGPGYGVPGGGYGRGIGVTTPNGYGLQFNF